METLAANFQNTYIYLYLTMIYKPIFDSENLNLSYHIENLLVDLYQSNSPDFSNIYPTTELYRLEIDAKLTHHCTN